MRVRARQRAKGKKGGRERKEERLCDRERKS
jgi:hypothetical protein